METNKTVVPQDLEQPYGSILGIIDSDPNARLPRVAKDTGGNPRGIEVRGRSTGTRHLGPGVASTDMGAGGDGAGLDADVGLERFVTP